MATKDRYAECERCEERYWNEAIASYMRGSFCTKCIRLLSEPPAPTGTKKPPQQKK